MKREFNIKSRRVGGWTGRSARFGGKGRVSTAATPELEILKKELLTKEMVSTPDLHTHEWLSRAADEAASLAWSTGYPLLLLPELMDEKLAAAKQKAAIQRDITLRSRVVLSLAV